MKRAIAACMIACFSMSAFAQVCLPGFAANISAFQVTFDCQSACSFLPKINITTSQGEILGQLLPFGSCLSQGSAVLVDANSNPRSTFAPTLFGANILDCGGLPVAYVEPPGSIYLNGQRLSYNSFVRDAVTRETVAFVLSGSSTDDYFEVKDDHLVLAATANRVTSDSCTQTWKLQFFEEALPMAKDRDTVLALLLNKVMPPLGDAKKHQSRQSSLDRKLELAFWIPMLGAATVIGLVTGVAVAVVFPQRRAL